MDLILIILVVLIVVGGPAGWQWGGPSWGGGIAGLLLLILLLYLLLGHARAAEAQLACAPAEQFDASVGSSKYHERRVFEGTGDSGATLYLYLNQETGSWTFARSMGPMICLLGGGFKSKVLLPIHVGEPS